MKTNLFTIKQREGKFMGNKRQTQYDRPFLETEMLDKASPRGRRLSPILQKKKSTKKTMGMVRSESQKELPSSKKKPKE